MKVVTLRLSDEEYMKILKNAENEHRPISNYITHSVLDHIEEYMLADNIEMAQINSDSKLQAKLKRGYSQAKNNKGKIIG